MRLQSVCWHYKSGRAMDNRQFLKMLMRGQQPKASYSRLFFVLDGKVHLARVGYNESSEDFNLAVVTSKADIAAWEAFCEAGKVDACNKLSKADITAWELYSKRQGLNMPDVEG